MAAYCRWKARSTAKTFRTRALTLIAIAPLIPGTTRISGIGTLKNKECDRIECPAAELRKTGVAVETGDDYIEVSEVPARTARSEEVVDIETYHDHRMAMSFAVLGTRLGNLNILDPDVVGEDLSAVLGGPGADTITRWSLTFVPNRSS